MRSVLRSVKKRKKSRRLGAVDVISREAYAGFEVDAKVEMIRALVPLGLMLVQELLDEEVTALAGARHARKEASTRGRRHGSNPGTVRLAGQRVPIRVPRVRGVTGGEIPLRSYEAARGDGQVHDVLLVKTEVRCPPITEVRCPLFTGYRVQSSRMMRLWECGHLARREMPKVRRTGISTAPSVGHVDASASTGAAFARRPSTPAFFFSRSR